MGLRLTQKQNEYIREANKRINLKIGAVRSGKSFVDVAYIIPRRIQEVSGKNGLNVILGVSKETIERNVLQPMREKYTDVLIGTINNRNIVKICGEDAYCLGAEKVSQISKIQGMSIKYLYGDEVAKWNKDVFMMALSRLDKAYSCMDASCNPEHPNHWLKQFIDREDIDLYIQKYTIFDNQFLPKAFVENLCKEYEGTVYYPRYILGEWTRAEGLIYPMYESAIVDDIPTEYSDFSLSIDYGTQNAFAAIIWGKSKDTWYAIDEYYYSGRDTGTQKADDDYADDLDKFTAWLFEKDENGRYLVDGKLETIIDPSAASFVAMLRKHGKYKVRKADNDVLNGIRETATAMNLGLIKVSNKLKNWKKEFAGYTWDEKSEKEQPIKEADHCLTGETVVMTEFGEKTILELIGTNGRVWSYNIESGKKELKPYRDCRMTQESAEIYEIEIEDGRMIRCTGEHPILTRRGYVYAKELVESDEIVDVFDGISYNVNKGDLHYD